MAPIAYAGQILKVDLSDRHTTRLLTADYADRFLGGRGIAARIFWEETGPEARALSPENCIVFTSGPLAGFGGLSASRWQICGNSPLMDPEAFSYANMGGSWGVNLKYAGYDGIAIKGKAEKPVYILIKNDDIEIRDASHLWGKTTAETEDALKGELGKQAKVLCIGPAAENMVYFSCILASENSSGSAGFGSVMGSKNLKAIVILSGQRVKPEAADPERLKLLTDRIKQSRLMNYEKAGQIIPGVTRRSPCYGCSTDVGNCSRGIYKAENGRYYKMFCQVSDVYREPADKYYKSREATRVNIMAGRFCDEYGLDTAVMQPLIAWIERCYQAGIFNENMTGLPLSEIGSSEFIQTLLRKISFREGFGNILADGTIRAAKQIGKGSEELISPHTITRASETRDYDPRLILANALIYALEPRRPIQLLHATANPLIQWLSGISGRREFALSNAILKSTADLYWGGAAASDFSNYEGKALAAKLVQDYGYLKESLVLCDVAWPLRQTREAQPEFGFLSLESQLVSAVTGRNLDATGLHQIGERIVNLQRSILIRQGWPGRQGDVLLNHLYREPMDGVFYDEDCLVPDMAGKPVSRMGAVVEKNEFEKLKDQYYRLRGWDVNSGYQTREALTSTGLTDIAGELESKGLLR